MLRGYLDSVTPSGFVEGWALDDAAPLSPLAVAVLTAKGEEIASGHANLYRDDLAASGIGYGWGAFRLALSVDPRAVLGPPLHLVEAATRASLVSGPAQWREDEGSDIADLDALRASDPTVLRSAEQLEGLAPLFDECARAWGAEAFVGAAYLYVLGRSVDPSGLESFTRQLRARRLTPYAVLMTLAESGEFVERGRVIPAPTEPGFPFLAP